MYHKARARTRSEGDIVSAWCVTGMIAFNRRRVLPQSRLQMCTHESKSMNEQHSGHRPLPTGAESSSELDKIRDEANRVAFDDGSHSLWNKVLDLCSKANTQGVLDAAKIIDVTAFWIVAGISRITIQSLYKRMISHETKPWRFSLSCCNKLLTILQLPSTF